jgi:hypothetical protein
MYQFTHFLTVLISSFKKIRSSVLVAKHKYILQSRQKEGEGGKIMMACVLCDVLCTLKRLLKNT